MIRRPPSSTRTYTLFPYTTLFRSRRGGIGVEGPLMLHLLAAARARRLEIEQVEDLAFSHEGATRQAARQDFRQGRAIRRDAIFLLGAAGRHAEPGHHFVEDQNDPVPGRQIAYRAQIVGCERHHAERGAGRVAEHPRPTAAATSATD